MTTLFSDDLESGGTSNWDSTLTSGAGSTLTVIAGAAKNGSYGLRCYKPTGSNNGYARAGKTYTFPASNVVSLQFWFYVVAVAGGGVMRAAYLYKEAPTYQGICSLICDGGTWSVLALLKDGSGITTPLSISLSTGTWYLVELVYDISGANPVHSCYVDGVLRATYTDTSTGSAHTPEVIFVDCYETSWNDTGDFYYDDVLLSDVQQAGGAFTSRLALMGVG